MDEITRIKIKLQNLETKIINAVRRKDTAEFNLALCEIKLLPEDQQKVVLDGALDSFHKAISKWTIEGNIYYYDDDSFIIYLRKLFEMGASPDSEEKVNNIFSVIINSMCEYPKICDSITDTFIEFGMKLTDARPMRTAVLKCLPGVAKRLLDAGMDPNLTVPEEWGHTCILNYAIAQMTFCLNDSSAYSDRAAEITKMLLDYGANPNFTATFTVSDAQLPHSIFIPCEPKTAQLLLDYGADMNVHDKYGSTILTYWTYKNNLTMVKFFLDKGADHNGKDTDGRTPIFYARSTEAVQLLLDAGADINAEADDGSTTLACMCHGAASDDMARFLVENGAEVNHQSKSGRAPLHYLTDKINLPASISLMQTLIELGADVNLCDNNGVMPFFNFMLSHKLLYKVIVSKKTMAFAEFMIEHGANIYVKDNTGRGLGINDDSQYIKHLIEFHNHINTAKQTMKTDLEMLER